MKIFCLCFFCFLLLAKAPIFGLDDTTFANSESLPKIHESWEFHGGLETSTYLKLPPGNNMLQMGLAVALTDGFEVNQNGTIKIGLSYAHKNFLYYGDVFELDYLGVPLSYTHRFGVLGITIGGQVSYLISAINDVGWYRAGNFAQNCYPISADLLCGVSVKPRDFEFGVQLSGALIPLVRGSDARIASAQLFGAYRFE